MEHMENENKKVIKYTFPVLFTYLFLGIGFGVMLKQQGYNYIWTFLSSISIFSGTMQYMLIEFLKDATPWYTVFFITLVVNGRYAFYGLSFSEKYKDYPWWLKTYLMFGLTDETYSILCLTALPFKEVNTRKYEAKVTFFNHTYWIFGTLLGNVLGELPIDFTGIDFIMTALFLTIVIDQLRNSKKWLVFIIAVLSSVICLIIFKNNFILPALLITVACLLIFRKKLEVSSNV